MKFGSLFAGIGGFDLGLERAGMSCAFQVERDPFAIAVLARHWPDVPRYPDIREVDPRELPVVDLLAGGFPCQPHSVAGKRQAAADERDLWPEFARIIRGTRPRWVLAENVPGLLSSERGRFFGRVLRDLAELGFDAEWQSIPASAFGAPHRRWRVFLVAYADGEGRQGAGRPGPQEPLARGSCASGDAPDAPSVGRGEGRPEPTGQQGRLDVASPSRKGLATYPDRQRQPQPQGRVFGERGRPGDCGWWSAGSALCGVAHGVPRRVDRLRGLGNAVVPQVAEWVGRQLMAAEMQSR